jgi:hypothetical protein
LPPDVLAQGRRRPAALVLLLVALAATLGFGACSRGGGDDGRVALDGSPRVPDVEGVVTKVADDFSTITLDGGRTYDIPRDVQSFSSSDGSTQPLRRRVGQYVQLGVVGRKVRWVAGLAAVVQGPAGPVVYYPGTVRQVDGRRLELADGTVLRLGPGVAPAGAKAATGKRVLASIDPERHVVVGLAQQ